MLTRRKAEVATANDSEPADALPTTADKADELRKELITKEKRELRRQRNRTTKRRRICQPPPLILIDSGKTRIAQIAARFFELIRALRVRISRLLWMETPQVRQRYEKRSYMVTYDEQDIVNGTESINQKVRVL
jgi:hypothetical protein